MNEVYSPTEAAEIDRMERENIASWHECGCCVCRAKIVELEKLRATEPLT